jgi:hypothetical protein
MLNGKTEEELFSALQRVFTLALDGEWKCDRAIRRVCIETLGEDVCNALRRIHKAEVRARGAAK